MGNNGDRDETEFGLLDKIAELVGEAKLELRKLGDQRASEVDAHKARLARIDAERKRLTRFIGIMEPTPRAPRKLQAKYNKGLGAAREAELVTVIRRLGANGATFSQKRLCEELGWNSSVVNTGFRQLRWKQFIGKVGRLNNKGEIGYKILDDKAVPR
jgi:hypothetical protein